MKGISYPQIFNNNRLHLKSCGTVLEALDMRGVFQCITRVLFQKKTTGF